MLTQRTCLRLFGFLSLVFACPSPVAADGISEKPFVGQPSIQTQIVHIDIAGVRLDVPRNYLETLVLASASKRDVVFVVVASLPDTSGATAETLRCFRSENWDWRQCNVVVVGSNGIARARLKEIAASALSAPEDETRFGLSRTTHAVGPTEWWVDRNSGAEGDATLFNCGIVGPRIGPCIGYVAVSDQLALPYKFPPSQLADWRELHERVQNLIAKFVVTGN